ncbi:MAG: ribonuclease HI family protein [Patescibacteria group bacterium]
MTKDKVISIYSDGGARGNPGPAGIGALLWQENKLVGQVKKYIGETTNNIAEYQAVYYGLEKAKSLKPAVVNCYMDSELVANQLNRQYKIKNVNLGPWFIKIWNLSQSFKKVNYYHIPREDNRGADKLVNQAIDERSK